MRRHLIRYSGVAMWAAVIVMMIVMFSDCGSLPVVPVIDTDREVEEIKQTIKKVESSEMSPQIKKQVISTLKRQVENLKKDRETIEKLSKSQDKKPGRVQSFIDSMTWIFLAILIIGICWLFYKKSK